MKSIHIHMLCVMAVTAAMAIAALGCSKESPTEPEDTIAPTVTISFPANGATLLGSVIVRADASDDRGIARVEFYVDGSLQKSVSSPGWEYMWDTRQSANGSHTVFAKAVDKAGNTSSSAVLKMSLLRTRTSIRSTTLSLRRLN
jgi:hypothetical protein